MIRPPWDGVAFSERADGDLRNDPTRRRDASTVLGLAPDWAEVSQVHDNRVVEVKAPLRVVHLNRVGELAYVRVSTGPFAGKVYVVQAKHVVLDRPAGSVDPPRASR